MKFNLWLYLVLLITVCGCETVRYAYTPPNSDQGRLCATQCGSTREACRNNQIQMSNKQDRQCEIRADSVLKNCLANAKDQKQREKCQLDQPYCGSFVDTDACDDEYNQCYSTCGGTVKTYIEH